MTYPGGDYYLTGVDPHPRIFTVPRTFEVFSHLHYNEIQFIVVSILHMRLPGLLYSQHVVKHALIRP